MTWIAQRHGQDWRDDDILNAIQWLTSLLPEDEWKGRITAVEAHFEAAKKEWSEGRRVPLYDPADLIGWYIHQARRYADPLVRPDFYFPEGFRVTSLFKRIGQLIHVFQKIRGAEDRAARLIKHKLSSPDDGIYELLVSGAYATRGWDQVEFVPEKPGGAKTPDLMVNRRASKWAVECKRAGRSGYARDERLAGERMAERAHSLSASSRKPLIAVVRYTEELHTLGDDYLVEKVETFLNGVEPFEWRDAGGDGLVTEIDWHDLHAVLTQDDVYFGSSRMVQLLFGLYDSAMDFTMAGDWTPAQGRPFHATWVDHASLVIWISRSAEAARRKAMHFRGLVGRASEQLPADRPGVIHVGYESLGGSNEDALRHSLNRREMRTFEPGATGLKMVYGNYFMNELVTSRNESAALVETMARYPIGTSRALGPLPNHLLFMDGGGSPGSHL